MNEIRDDRGRIYDFSYIKGILSKRQSFLANKGVEPEWSYCSPKVIQFDITAKCNLKCVFCYNDSGPCRGATDMSADNIKKIAEQIVKIGPTRVNLSGGEVLLRKELLFDLLDIFTSNDIIVYILTNGVLITEAIVDRLKKYQQFISGIQISIDGTTSGAHDKIRGVPGAWRASLRAAKLISDAGLNLSIAHVICKENYTQMEEMIQLVFLLGIKTIRTGFVLPFGRANEEESLLAEAEYKVLSEKLYELVDKYKDLLNIVHTIELDQLLEIEEIKPIASLLIDSDGTVRKSCTERDIIYGSLKRETLQAVWENAVSKDIKRLKRIRASETSSEGIV